MAWDDVSTGPIWEQPPLPVAPLEVPPAMMSYITQPAMAAAPMVTVLPVSAGPQPAPGLGINANTLLIGGAVIAALLLLRGK